MSSGADLLRKLQERRRRQANTCSYDSSSECASSGTKMRETTIIAAAVPPPLIPSSQTQPVFVAAVVVVITVCTGSNCGATGGGTSVGSSDSGGCGSGGCSCGTSATLLEIEELVQETSNKMIIFVESGGCTDHCTMGPNVFVRTTTMKQKTKTTRHHHFTKVNSALAYADVVHYAAEAAIVGPSSLSSASAHSIMLRRADGLRWKALRQLARVRIGESGSCTTSQKNLLNQAVDTEVAAVRSDPERVARAERRRRRLLAVLDKSTAV